MGPYRMKPLDVVEREIDQLSELYPSSFLQFTDDNLLVSRRYAADLLTLIREKKRRFVTMVTVDQFCDRALVEEMAASGCLGVAVGVESIDDENCTSVSKSQNIEQPFSDAVRFANKCGIQVGALMMVGLPHDTPSRLEGALKQLREIACTFYDIRILRIYPSTPLYSQMLLSGDVTETWWLDKKSTSNCNDLLPSCLSMDFMHSCFAPMELQRVALRLIVELNPMKHKNVSHILRVGHRAHALDFAAMLIIARRRSVRQARMLLKKVDQAMATNVSTWPEDMPHVRSAGL
jgi:radical SAM superfamily enzyme YgiQ (UPF0313 family)